MKFAFKMGGFKKTAAKLALLKKTKAKSIWRKGVRAAGSVVLKAARPTVATASKTLKKSLALRVKVRRKDKAVVAIVGPRQKFFKTWKGKLRKPSKYAHLVEGGRKAKVRFSLRKGPYIVKGVRARSFIGTPLKRSRGNAMRAMADKIAEELEKL